MRITERYLQHLMESHGETFSRFVSVSGSTRLRPCSRSNATTAFPKSHFSAVSATSRSFKKRFGENPKAYRK
jgi:AraC-like DNA-binding protein